MYCQSCKSVQKSRVKQETYEKHDIRKGGKVKLDFLKELADKVNKKKYREAYDKAEQILTELKEVPMHKIPYEVLQMHPQEVYGNNEIAYGFLTEQLLHTMEMHREIENMATYYYNKMALLGDYVNMSIARTRIYNRTNFREAFRESAHFLEKLYPITNQYHDDMVSQMKIIEAGAYGEFKVNEKLKKYAQKHNFKVLENIRLEVGIDKESAETDTILITDKAIFSIETKYFGSYEIEVDENNQWFRNKGGHKSNMGKSPSNQSVYHVKNLKNFFEEMSTDLGKLPIIPVVVMANPKTKFRNNGNVKVYSIEHMNNMFFNDMQPVISEITRGKIAELIASHSLEGKLQKFYDYYEYFCKVRERMQEWFRYYDVLFDITMKIFKSCDYVTYEYDKYGKIVQGEKQILGVELYNQVIEQYKQIIRMEKERTQFDGYFGKAYRELHE